MGKPRLPLGLEYRFPREILHLIYRFVPPLPSPKHPSPQLQKELMRLQSGNKKTAMYLKDLDDFVLDKQ